MTIIEAINEVDELCPNTYSQEQKIKWLSQLDLIIKANIIDTHETGSGMILGFFFDGYDENTPLDTDLLVEAPHDNIYILWLEAKIYYASGETGRFNNTNVMYSAEFQALYNDYNRTHMPKGTKIRYF